jgi:hypothetical protein
LLVAARVEEVLRARIEYHRRTGSGGSPSIIRGSPVFPRSRFRTVPWNRSLIWRVALAPCVRSPRTGHGPGAALRPKSPSHSHTGPPHPAGDHHVGSRIAIVTYSRTASRHTGRMSALPNSRPQLTAATRSRSYRAPKLRLARYP